MNTNQEGYEIKITPEGYEIEFIYTPEEEEEFHIMDEMEKGDYFEISAKILKILSELEEDPYIAKNLRMQSNLYFEVVDETKELKIGTTRKKHHYMTYEKKIVDIIKNKQKAIDDVYWAQQIKMKNLLPQEVRKLEKLRYYEKEDVIEYEYNLADDYDGIPQF